MYSRLIRNQDITAALTLWNNCCGNLDFLYKPMDETTFVSKFMNKNEAFQTHTYVTYENNCMIGFASGVQLVDSKTAYITFCLIRKDKRRQGHGVALIKMLETTLIQSLDSQGKIDIVFFNPVNLEWIIPKFDKRDHPNAPGVDTTVSAFEFFKHLGYQAFAIQNSYYKDISQYQYSAKTKAKINRLHQEGIVITLFDANKHHGYEALLDNLGSPNWKEEIVSAIQVHDSPVLIAHQHGLVIGFAGPLRVQECMRGYFTGIGVHSKYRGYGAGGVLFSGLCMHLKQIGAQYMTLFTGEKNAARHIYEREGFKIVRSWANMRKEFK